MHDMGCMYEEGKGVAQFTSKGYYWISYAAIKNHEAAKFIVASME